MKTKMESFLTMLFNYVVFHKMFGKFGFKDMNALMQTLHQIFCSIFEEFY